MKSLTNTLMVAAAAMAAVAGAASAQSMKVEVPFAFRVSGTVMPAGTYQVSTSSAMTSRPTFRLLNTELKRPVLAMPVGELGTGENSRVAKLVFRCGDGACALAQIWTGTGHGAYYLPSPKSSHDDKAMVEIKVERTKADE